MKKDSVSWNWLAEILKKFIWLIKMCPCNMFSTVCVGYNFSTVILGKLTYIVLSFWCVCNLKRFTFLNF